MDAFSFGSPIAGTPALLLAFLPFLVAPRVSLGIWHIFRLRREVLLVRVEVEDLHQPLSEQWG